MDDGEIQSYTLAEIKAHLAAIRCCGAHKFDPSLTRKTNYYMRIY